MKAITSLALTAALGISTAVAAQEALTQRQVEASLAQQGYSKVRGLEFRDGVWTAKARSANGESVKATLIKYRRRHDAWKAGRVCRAAPGRLAVLPSRAAQPGGLPGITPSL